jgi:hypothetical protein
VSDEQKVDLREVYRAQMLTSIGGWEGTVIAAVPTVVFVVVNAFTSLRTAIYAAIGSALVLAVYRLARRRPVQQAISSLLGVVVAAFIAGRTGQARGYFLPGIIISLAYSVPFLISIPVRRPLIGLGWEFLEPTPHTRGAAPKDPHTGEQVATDDPPWWRLPVLLRAYTWSTVVASAVFLARGLVQLTLYLHANGDDKAATGWLAFARIAMGFPLFVVGVLAILWLVRRAKAEVRSGPRSTS